MSRPPKPMRQLPLHVGPADQAVFDNFLPGANAPLLHALREVATVAQRAMLWAWGPPESGRTHLLQATTAAADVAGYRTAFLPAGNRSMAAAALEGLGELDVVCVDDVDQVAGQDAWERALFLLFEQLRQAGSRLVLSARCAPLHASFRLPDLASRLSSGATFRVQPLTDDQKQQALQHRAAWRGLDLPDETAQYLLTRAHRSTAALFGLLERLDSESLAAQKRLTVPFVRGVLEATPGEG
jgi:DnaA family protein